MSRAADYAALLLHLQHGPATVRQIHEANVVKGAAGLVRDRLNDMADMGCVRLTPDGYVATGTPLPHVPNRRVERPPEFKAKVIAELRLVAETRESSARQIARRYCIADSTVDAWVKEAGIDLRPPKPEPRFCHKEGCGKQLHGSAHTQAARFCAEHAKSGQRIVIPRRSA